MPPVSAPQGHGLKDQALTGSYYSTEAEGVPHNLCYISGFTQHPRGASRFGDSPRRGHFAELPYITSDKQHGINPENRVKSDMNNNLGYIIPIGIKLGEPNMSHGARSPTEKVIRNLPFVIILPPINEKITSIRGQTIQNVYGLPLKEVRTK